MGLQLVCCGQPAGGCGVTVFVHALVTDLHIRISCPLTSNTSFTPCTVPLKGRQKTQKRKAQTFETGKRRWPPESHPETATTSTENHRLLSKVEKRFKKERENDKKLQRRERHLRKKLKKEEELPQARFKEGAEEGARIAGERCEGSWRAKSTE